METKRISVIARAMACMTFVLFFIAFFQEWTVNLAPDAATYQHDYPDSLRSGFSVWNAVSKGLWIAGVASGVVGLIHICRLKGGGSAPLAASAPAIAIGALLTAPQDGFPSLEPTYVVILWSGAAAAWASTLTLAFMFRTLRHEKQR